MAVRILDRNRETKPCHLSHFTECRIFILKAQSSFVNSQWHFTNGSLYVHVGREQDKI